MAVGWVLLALAATALAQGGEYRPNIPPRGGNTRLGYPPEDPNGQSKPEQTDFDFGPTDYGPSQQNFGPPPFAGPQQNPYGNPSRPDLGSRQPGLRAQQLDYRPLPPDSGNSRPSYTNRQPDYGRSRPAYPPQQLALGRPRPEYPPGQPDYGRLDPSYSPSQRVQPSYPPSQKAPPGQRSPGNGGFFSNGNGVGHSLLPTLGILNGVGPSGDKRQTSGPGVRGPSPAYGGQRPNLPGGRPNSIGYDGEQDLLKSLGPSARPFDDRKATNFPRLGDPPAQRPAFQRPDPRVDQYGNASPYVPNPYPSDPYEPPKRSQQLPRQQSTHSDPNGSPGNHQNPYQNQGPNPYLNQSPNPYQNPALNPYQNKPSIPYQNQPPIPYQNKPPIPYQHQPPIPYQNQPPIPYQNKPPIPYQNQPPKQAQAPNQSPNLKSSSKSPAFYPFPKASNPFSNLFGGNTGLDLFARAAKANPKPNPGAGQNSATSQQPQSYPPQLPPRGSPQQPQNYPPRPDGYAQQPQTLPQQKQNSFPSLTVSSLYPRNLPIKPPNRYGVQNNQQNPKPGYQNQRLPQNGQYLPKLNPPPNYSSPSAGYPGPQPAFNGNAHNHQNSAGSQKLPGFGGAPQGYPPVLNNPSGPQTPFNIPQHQPPQRPQPPIHYPPQPQKPPVHPSPTRAPISYPSSGSTARNVDASPRRRVFGGSRNTAYDDGNRDANGDTYKKSNSYSTSDGGSNAKQGGYDTRNQYSDRNKAHTSSKNMKSGGDQNSYSNQRGHTTSYKSPSSGAVPVSYGPSNQKSSSAKGSNQGPPPIHAVPKKPEAKAVSSTTAPKSSKETTTDKYGYLKPRKPSAADFGLDNLFNFSGSAKTSPNGGKLFGKSGFPSFTNVLSKELKGLF